MRTLREYRIGLEAFAAIAIVRVLPFRIARRVRFLRSRSAMEPAFLVRAVQAIARRTPGTTCLTRVLAGSILFHRYGHHANVRLGVARDDGKLAAHAWLESNGRAVMEEPEEGSFVALVDDGADEVVRMRVGDLDLRERGQ